MTEENIKKIEERMWDTMKKHTTPQVVNHAMVKVRDFLTANPDATDYEIVGEIVHAICDEGMIDTNTSRNTMLRDVFEPNAALVELRSNLYDILKEIH